MVAIAGAGGAHADGDAADDPDGHRGDEYEYRPLRLDPSTSRASAAVMLAVRAEFTGWELAHVLRYPDGTRAVTLRRRRSAGAVAALSL